MASTVSQKRFLRGLNAGADILSQPQGTIARIMNMIYNIRGALKTCDGSKAFALHGGGFQTIDGPITEIFLYQPTGKNRYYVGIQKSAPSGQLAAPAGLIAADGGAGGGLTGTFFYVVTAIDGAGGETTISNEVNITVAAGHKINLNWTASPFVTGYNIYRGTGSTLEKLTKFGVTTNSYIDTGDAAGTFLRPLVNTTQACFFWRFLANWGAGALGAFAADPIQAISQTDAGLDPLTGEGGGGGYTPPNPVNDPLQSSGTGAAQTPSGGVSGNASALPQLMQFVNKVILCLGNGLPLFTWDDTTLVQITNTFNAVYPDWQTATAFVEGDVILDSVSGNLFKVTQSGVSAAGRPAFPTVLNATISDNKIIWENVGVYTATPAPRGAAHGVVYAGSLWVANTSPLPTTDQLDGPSALRMSDINNPNSWNPLNAANLSKDDGTQIMGLSPFTISEQGVAPTGSLVVFKEFSTFQIIGVFGASDFSIQQAKTDLGCIAPRTIQFLPGYGIGRLTHLGVAIFNGVGDQIISEEIRPYLFDNPLDDINAMDWNYAYFAKASQTANPPMYVMAIPVALPNFTGFTIQNLIPAGWGYFASDKYYFVMTKRSPSQPGSGEFAISQEIGPRTLIPATNASQIFTFPVLAATDPDDTVYRLYAGIGSRKQQAYLEVAGSRSVPVTITLGTLAGMTPGVPSIGAGALTRLLCYDLVLKAWAIIDLPFGIGTLKQFRAAGSIPITVVGGWSDGTLRQIQAGDATWDGTTISWSFRTTEVFGEGGSQRVHYRRVGIRGNGNSTDVSSIQVTPQYEGTSDIPIAPEIYLQGTNEFEARADLLVDAKNANVTISGTGSVEIDSVDWEVTPKPTGTPPIFS